MVLDCILIGITVMSLIGPIRESSAQPLAHLLSDSVHIRSEFINLYLIWINK